MWLRFNALEPEALTPPLLIGMEGAGSPTAAFEPFAGRNGGYWLGSRSPRLPVESLNQSALNWHHYAVTWNATSAARRMYVDGRLVVSDEAGVGLEYSWLEMRPYLLVGGHCYKEHYHSPVVAATCKDWMSGDGNFDGEMDDVAIFGGVLTDEEIALRWNASLSTRLREGLEPRLVVFYNFDEATVERRRLASAPAGGADACSAGAGLDGVDGADGAANASVAVDVEVVRNLGSAGRELDLTLGVIKPGLLGGHFLLSDASTLLRVRAPMRVPSRRGLSSKPRDLGAPLVVPADPLETIVIRDAARGISGLTINTSELRELAIVNASGNLVHVLPRSAPSVPDGSAGDLP